MIYQLTALWLLLSAAAATVLYDDYSDSENEVLHQQEHVDVSRHAAHQARLEDLLLFRLIKELFREELQDEMRRSHEERVKLEAMQGAVKRVFPERNARPQRRWKSKKGRYADNINTLIRSRGNGNQMCYFKLCAFRTSV